MAAIAHHIKLFENIIRVTMGHVIPQNEGFVLSNPLLLRIFISKVNVMSNEAFSRWPPLKFENFRIIMISP